MLAATTCSSVRSPADRRENRLARGSTVRIRANPSSCGGSTADPVADRGERRPRCGMVTQPARDARQPLARLGEDAIDVGVLQADPAGNQPGCAGGRQLRFETLRPAQLTQRRHQVYSARSIGDDYPARRSSRPSATRPAPCAKAIGAHALRRRPGARRASASSPGSGALRRRSTPARRTRVECTASRRRRSR